MHNSPQATAAPSASSPSFIAHHDAISYGIPLWPGIRTQLHETHQKTFFFHVSLSPITFYAYRRVIILIAMPNSITVCLMVNLSCRNISAR